ncbi:recombinase family protein [Nonomuraea sp. NPDC023979]|uniref:recombinase family protein n=1 Tax=Nonomuraea sp. NPDC023979 TaxID=3154796 RepID=UPI0033FC13B9
MKTKRVLGVIRLSNLTDDTSSPARQRAKIDGWADLKDAHVVGYAEDLDVSAITKGPWDRPELAAWLDKPDAYDVVVCWKLDRLARNALDFLELLRWADDHSVEIVAIDDGIDLSSDVGRMVATILAVFAEFEGKTMRARAKQAYDHNVKAGKWRGGFLPYGYRPVKADDGWRLEIDPETSAVLREVVGLVIEGRSINSITRELNRRGVPTSLDVQRVRAGKEPKGALWRVGNLIKLLRSKTLLGQYEAQGSEYDSPTGERKVVRGSDGMPVQRAEPLISLAEWERLQAALDGNSNKRAGNRKGGSPLLQVAYCAVCARPLYRNPSGHGDWFSYRCSAKAVSGLSCGNGSIRDNVLEARVEEAILERIGHLPRHVKVHVPGEDHSEALEQAQMALTELSEQLGAMTSKSGRQAVLAQITALDERIAKLETMPSRPSSIEWLPTGETFGEHWSRLDTEGRGRFLRSAGVRVEVLKWPDLRSPDEWPDLPTSTLGGITYALGPDGTGKRNTPPMLHLVIPDLDELVRLGTRS